jgi:hypothetical protein
MSDDDASNFQHDDNDACFNDDTGAWDEPVVAAGGTDDYSDDEDDDGGGVDLKSTRPAPTVVAVSTSQTHTVPSHKSVFAFPSPPKAAPPVTRVCADESIVGEEGHVIATLVGEGEQPLCFAHPALLTELTRMITDRNVPGCYLVGTKGCGKRNLLHAAARAAGSRVMVVYGEGGATRKRARRGAPAARSHPNGRRADDDDDDDDDDLQACRCDSWRVARYGCGGGDECALVRAFVAFEGKPLVLHITGTLSAAGVRAVRRLVRSEVRLFAAVTSDTPMAQPPFFTPKDVDPLSADQLYDRLTAGRAMSLWVPPPCLATRETVVPRSGIELVRAIITRITGAAPIVELSGITAALAWCSGAEMTDIISVALVEHAMDVSGSGNGTLEDAVRRGVTQHESMYARVCNPASAVDQRQRVALRSPFTATTEAHVAAADAQPYAALLFSVRNVHPFAHTDAFNRTVAILRARWRVERHPTVDAHMSW